MSDNLQELFQAAAKYFFSKYKENGGSLGKLAAEIGTSHTYVSAVINGSRSASLVLQDQIANALYGPFDKFIAAGRQIKMGLQPEDSNGETPRDEIESLIAQLTHYVMEQKEVKKRLISSEEKYRDICLTCGDMIVEMNKEMVLTYVSSNVSEVTGLTRDAVLGKNIYDFLDREESARIQALVEQSINKRTILKCDINIKQNGHLKHRQVVAKPVIDQAGQFTGMRGTYRDITERRKLEQAIDEQRWLLESAIDSVEHVGIVITDKNSTILKWNNYYQELMGYPDDVLETRKLSIIFKYLQPMLSDSNAFHKTIDEVKKSKDKIVHTFSLKDGRTIERTVYPMFRNGCLSGRIAHLIDVTEK